MKSKIMKAVSLIVVSPVFLYLAGIVEQFIVNIRAWQAAGSDYNTSPGLPSLKLGDVFSAAFHWPEGYIAMAAVAVGILLFCIFGLHIGWEQGSTDRERKLTVSSSGSCGTASFMSEKEAAQCFEIKPVEKTDQDILGMDRHRKVITLPARTRLNHNLSVCGASGTGKSRSISRNLILQTARRGESMVITDSKSELYESMSEYLRDQGYTVKVFNLIQMEHSDSWNCLSEVKGNELMAQIFSDVVLSNTGGNKTDPFWHSAELNLLKALVLYVSSELAPSEQNLGTVYDMLVKNDVNSLRRLMLRISKEHVEPSTGEVLPPSPAIAPFSIFMQSSETVRSGVIIGLGSKLQVIQAQAVRNITSYNEIDLELPGKEKCAYFCIVSDQDSTFNFLSSLFFAFLFIRLVRYADNYCDGGALTVPVKFILDEFPNCCFIPDFTKKCSTVRSRGISLAIFFQNIGQMKNRYPDDQWQEILGSCDSMVFLGCTDVLTAKYISDRIGVASVELESEARDLNTMNLSNYTPNYRRTRSIGRRQLMTPDEVLRLPPDHELIFIRGQKVYQARRFDYSKHCEYKKLRSSKAILHEPDWKKKAGSKQENPNDKERIPIPAGAAVHTQDHNSILEQLNAQPSRKKIDLNDTI